MSASFCRWPFIAALILVLTACSSSTVTVTAPREAGASGSGSPPTLPPFAITPDEIGDIVLTTEEVPGLEPVSGGALADDGGIVAKGALRGLEFGWYSTFGIPPEVWTEIVGPDAPPTAGIADGLTFATSAVAVLPLAAARRAAVQAALQHEVEVDPELCDNYGYGQGSPPMSECPYARFFPQSDYALTVGLRDQVPCANQTVPVHGGRWTWITCTWVMKDLRTYPRRGVVLTFSAGGGEHFDPQAFVDLVDSKSVVRALVASVRSATPSPSGSL